MFILQQNPSAQAALQAAQALVNQTDTQGGPNTVLRVIVEHMIYPVTLDVLYQVRYILMPLCLSVCCTRTILCVFSRPAGTLFSYVELISFSVDALRSSGKCS